MTDTPERIKVVLLGDSEVGKTSLLLRYVKGTFNHNRRTSVGVAVTFLSKLMELNGDRVFVNFWDTAGEERYRAIAPNYYRHAQGALLVYDVTSRKTFSNIQAWIDELHQRVDHVSIIVVGNKTDLEQEREISTKEGKEMAEKNNCDFFETSAKDDINVAMMFNGVAEVIVDKIRGHQGQRRKGSTNSVIFVQTLDEKKSDCCNCKS